MVTTNQKPTTDTQKVKRNEYNPNTKESHQITREKNKRMKRITTKQPENNQQNGNTHIPIKLLSV